MISQKNIDKREKNVIVNPVKNAARRNKNSVGRTTVKLKQ